MIKIKNIFLRKINMLLTSMVAALGVVGCATNKVVTRQSSVSDNDNQQDDKLEEIRVSEERQVVCMYGVPRARYVVEARVIDEAGYPIVEKNVTVMASYEKIDIKTDSTGMFSLTFDGFPAEQIKFVIDDDETYTEKVVYDAESQDVWNRGTATMKVTIVVDKNKNEVQTIPPIMVKYGVPHTRQIK